MNDYDINGWDKNQLDTLIAALEDAQELLYEINNCVRGCRSGAHTYQELGEYARRVANRITTGAEDCDYAHEEEYDEED